jgi:hypothetical protein
MSDVGFHNRSKHWEFNKLYKKVANILFNTEWHTKFGLNLKETMKLTYHRFTVLEKIIIEDNERRIKEYEEEQRKQKLDKEGIKYVRKNKSE